MKKYILILVAIVLVIKGDEIYWLINPPPDFSNTDNEVVLYATSWCGYCSKARNYLNRIKVPYIEHDIEKSQEANEQFNALGGSGVPLILVNGNVIKGYSKDLILKYLMGEEG